MMARSLYALGHVVHLLQDQAQPAHSRNDAHPLDAAAKYRLLRSFGRLEFWVSSTGKKEVDSIIKSASLSLPPPASASESYARYFDRDRGVPASSGDAQGLGEFSNYNFQSTDTVFTTLDIDSTSGSREFDSAGRFEPITARTDFAAIRQQPGLALRASCDGSTDEVQYIRRTADPTAAYYLRLSCLSEYCSADAERFAASLYQDRCVFREYAQLLLPRAVSYSAALIDYFFRGGVSADWNPIGNGDFRVTVTNLSAERLKGRVTLALRVPPGTHGLSGDEDILLVSGSRSVDLGPFGETDDRAEVEVLAQDIPGLDWLTESALSFERRVVVEGDLGGELKTAVVAGIAPALTSRLLARIHRSYPTSTASTWESIDVETGHSVWTRAAAPNDGTVRQPSPDGRTLVWVSNSSPPRLTSHDFSENDALKDRELSLILPAGVSSLWISPGVSGSFSPDGRRLLTLGTVGGVGYPRLVEIELASGRVKIHPQEIDAGLEVSWSSGGEFALTGTGLASLRSGTIERSPQPPPLFEETYPRPARALSADGATSYHILIEFLWPYFQNLFSFAWSGDGWRDLGAVTTWPTGNPACSPWVAESLSLSPDGRLVAYFRSIGNDGGGDLVVRNMQTGKERVVLAGPRDCGSLVGQIGIDQLVWTAETTLETPPPPSPSPGRSLLVDSTPSESPER